MTESNIENIGELIVVEHKSLPILFSEGKADILVDEIEKKVRSFVPDIETIKGRKDIASLSHKIARSKTLLDNAGKQLTADWKAKSKLVDQERSRVWARLESLQEEIRKPLTEYENIEKERKDDHQCALGKFRTILVEEIINCNGEILALERGIESSSLLFNSRDWEEFTDQATELYQKTILTLKEKIANKKVQIETQKREEAERLLREEIERRLREEQAIRERDQEIARQDIENEKRQQIAREVAERERLREEKKKAEDRIIKAEQDRLQDIEKHKAEKIALEEKAKRDIEEAIQRERGIIRGTISKDEGRPIELLPNQVQEWKRINQETMPDSINVSTIEGIKGTYLIWDEPVSQKSKPINIYAVIDRETKEIMGIYFSNERANESIGQVFMDYTHTSDKFIIEEHR